MTGFPATSTPLSPRRRAVYAANPDYGQFHHVYRESTVAIAAKEMAANRDYGNSHCVNGDLRSSSRPIAPQGLTALAAPEIAPRIATMLQPGHCRAKARAQDTVYGRASFE